MIRPLLSGEGRGQEEHGGGVTQTENGTTSVPKLLLVEDNPDDVALTRRALSRARIGNDLAVAGDGEAALDVLYRDVLDGRRDIGLVLLDLGLPKLDGREVLERVWADRRLRHIPVIVLTSSAKDEDMVKSYKGGAVAFLRKPVQVDRLLHAVSDLHGYRLLIARVPE
jgi:two-component system response regulator